MRGVLGRIAAAVFIAALFVGLASSDLLNQEKSVEPSATEKEQIEAALKHFAGAQMQNVMVRLKFDDREVWSVPQLEWSVAFDHTQPYRLFNTPGK